MRLNPARFIQHRLGIAIDWRVRDVLEAEREATVELGQTFVRGYAQLADRQSLFEGEIASLKKRITELEEGR